MQFHTPRKPELVLVLACCVLVSALLVRARPAAAAFPALPATAPANVLLGMGLDTGGEIIFQPNVMTLADQSGAGWARLALYWRSAEPTDTTPQNFIWPLPGSDIDALSQGGLTPVVYISQNPSWASALPCGPIDTTKASLVADFGEFMGAAARRYPQVPIWILYNEADNGYSWIGTDGCFGDDMTGDANKNGMPDVGDYAVMLATARDAVRQVNPNTRVAISVAFDNFDARTCPPNYPGGCPPASNFNFNFLPNLFAYMKAHPRPGGAPYADDVALNYYDVYGPYWESRVGKSYHGIQAKVQFIRQIMQQGGVNLGMFVTETGESSGADWVGLEGQSQCVVTQLVRGSGAGLQGVSWWTLTDVPQNNWYYGVLDAKLNPKPSYYAYQTLVQKLTGYAYNKNLSTKKVEAYQFAYGKKKRIVAWSSAVIAHAPVGCADTRKPKPLTLSKVKRVSVTDMYAKTTTIIKDNSKADKDKRPKYIKIKVGSVPTYIDLNP